MKLLPFLLGFVLLSSLVVNAQNRTITGKVTDGKEGIPGATILIKGTNQGAAADIEGNYSLDNVPSDGTLVFTAVGFTSKEVKVGASNVINVVLAVETKELTDVQITVVGKKSTKSIGYASTVIQAQDITRAKERSPLNALQGKVAGVQITSASGSPGSSTRIIFRGFSSLTGSNQPLFVIDGIPVSNGSTNSTDLNSGVDFGNAMNNINPEDIESMTFIKGSSGAALYGSRAANGVVIITTKSGKAAAARGKKVEVSFSSSATFETPLKLPKFQNEFGQGFFGEADLLENTSWGPRFDGKVKLWGRIVDGEQRYKPYSALPNNVKDFFDIGRTYSNSISFSGGSQDFNYYLSYSNVDADGIMPTESDSYKRNTLSAKASASLSGKMVSSFSLNYTNTAGRFVPTGQGSTVLNNIWQTPRDISLLELRDYKDKFNDLEGYYSPYTDNPWMVLNEYGNKYLTERLFGSTNLTYNFTDWLKSDFTLGTDISSQGIKLWEPKNTILGPNASNSNTGGVTDQSIYNSEITADLKVIFNKRFATDFNVNAILGYQVNQRRSRNLVMAVRDLTIPGFYNIKNSAATPTVTGDETKRRLTGLYTSIDLSYKNYLYLTLMARNDWSSTLPAENRTFFYPAVTGSFIFSELLPDLKKTLSFGKLRVGYGKTGNDAPVYSVNSIFVLGSHGDGFRSLNYPLPGGINGFEQSNVIGNPNLKPEITTEFEVGTELKFFESRLGLDFGYYDRKIEGLIVNAPVSVASGFTSQTLNIGEVQNKGIELTLTASPVISNDFSWDVSINYARNRNKVIQIGEGIERLGLGGTGAISFITVPGEYMGLFEGSVPLTDPQGRIVVNASTGLPIVAPVKEVLGNAQHKFTGGITNIFTYKGISLTGTFDVRWGGKVYSRTADIMYFAGTTPATLYNDRNPFVLPNSVIDLGGGNYVENTTPITDDNLQRFWDAGGVLIDRAFLIDRSFVKLRELSVSYTLPKKISGPFSNVQLGIIGRNLWIWTPKSNIFNDPEQTTFGNDVGADYGDFGATPTVRSVGFNLRATF